MGTRAMIARPTAEGFTGRIVLNDGPPDTAVPILLDLVSRVHGGDVAAAVRQLIDAHPGGWDQLPASDMPHGVCMCHGGPRLDKPASTVPLDHGHKGEAEFAYVLHPDHLAVLIPGEDAWVQIAIHPWTA